MYIFKRLIIDRVSPFAFGHWTYRKIFLLGLSNAYSWFYETAETFKNLPEKKKK